MCTLKTWYSGRDGCILQCKDCSHFQVMYGTTMLTLQDWEFETFIKGVSDRLSGLEPGDANLRHIVQTPSSVMNMVLTGKEMHILNEILQQVDNERKAVALFDLFNGDSYQ